MIAKFNPTGTHIHKDYLKVRIDLYPDVDDKTYKIHHVLMPVFPPEGYQGKVDKEGIPVDQNDYNNWLDNLPKVWQLNPCLCHFIRIKETSTKSDLVDYLEQIFNPTVIKTLDDSLILPNSIHLVSPLMRNKAALTTEKIVTKDIKDLVETVNSRFASLALKKASGDKGLSIVPQTIDIGTAAIERDYELSSGRSYIVKENSANATGTIDTVEIYHYRSGNAEVATFIDEGSDVLSTRDSEDLGNIFSGGKRTIPGLDMDVVVGDYIGHYTAVGSLWLTLSGAGYWWLEGDQIPANSVTFTPKADRTVSLYGTGTEAGAPEGHPYSSRVQGVQGMRSWGGI